MPKEVQQHINALVHGHVIAGNLTANHTIHNYGPVYFLCLPPAQTPTRRTHSERRSSPRPTTGEAQREVLALIDRMPDPTVVLKFMEREFYTSVVIELAPQQLYRVKRYAEAILSRTGTRW